jgi:tetratricopeptide (TPR) repeat protein
MGQGISVLQALIQSGTDLWQCFRVGQWLEREIHDSEALEVYNWLIEQGLTHEEVHFGRHRILLRQGDAQGALEAANEALAVNPQHGYAHLFRGDAYHAMGRNTEARESWETCLEADIDGGSHRMAQRRIRRLGRSGPSP